MNFSLAEQRIALSAILRKYELSFPENSIYKNRLKFSIQLLILSAKLSFRITPSEDVIGRFGKPKDIEINFTRKY
jgi:hypothetical protein